MRVEIVFCYNLFLECKIFFGVEWGYYYDRVFIKNEQMIVFLNENGCELYFGCLYYNNIVWCFYFYLV